MSKDATYRNQQWHVWKLIIIINVHFVFVFAEISQFVMIII